MNAEEREKIKEISGWASGWSSSDIRFLLSLVERQEKAIEYAIHDHDEMCPLLDKKECKFRLVINKILEGKELGDEYGNA